jgi:endonuclease YncB( thermonuclease family)
MQLKVSPTTSFLYAEKPGAKPRLTKKYVGAYVLDHGKQKKVITSSSTIKIRLQGIDAPELHFPSTAKRDPLKKGKPNEARQPFGASAAQALHEHLKTFLQGRETRLHATFVTRVASAADAIDSHGRFVGDILVSGKSINTWLVANGWAFPLFYDSMAVDEIKTLLEAWKDGRMLRDRIGAALEKGLQPFDPSRQVDNAELPDSAPLNLPKIFRRQVDLWFQTPGDLSGTDFAARLKAGAVSGKPDFAFPLDYFLEHAESPAPSHRVKMHARIGDDGSTNFAPEELVFKEDPSVLLGPNGKPVSGW